MQIKYILFYILFPISFFGQNLKTISKLDTKLHEISGLESLNDSVLIAHNDSGGEPILYFLNLKGEIIHETMLVNAKNVDWEDLSMDRNYIYVGDIGNNTNKRKNLCIYKIQRDSIMNKSEIKAEKIKFSYEDQLDFPPDKSERQFDAEALAVKNDTLFIFTKCQTKPFNGISNVYILPTRSGEYSAKKVNSLQFKSRKLQLDGVTAADFRNDTCYILTYSGVEIFTLKNNTFTKIGRNSFLKLSQKEALCIHGSFIYIADEYKNNLLKSKLYKFKIR